MNTFISHMCRVHNVCAQFHFNILICIDYVSMYGSVKYDINVVVIFNYSVSQKKTSPTFLAITRESIDRFL